MALWEPASPRTSGRGQVKRAASSPVGGATGGVLNTTVKSGTNDFSGGVNLFYTPRSGYSDYKKVTSSVGAINPEDNETTDIGLSVGGPIIKDTLFYFAAFNPVRHKDRFTIGHGLRPRFAPASVVPRGRSRAQERTRILQLGSQADLV
jgi:hypothetical protein